MADQGEQPPQPDHGPYRPEIQALGGSPNSFTDVPVSAVFLTLFVLAAILHMGLFKRNQIKLHKLFPMNAATFGFCITRIIANTFRIIWANYPQSVAIGMVAQLFVYAGIPILFVGNLIFAQRIVRAQHPYFGWKTPFTIAMLALIFITVATIVVIIPAVVYGFFTLEPTTTQRIRDIQLFALTTFAIVALLPLPIVLISAAARRKSRIICDDFGTGSMRTKILIVIVTSVILSIGAIWRAWTLFMPQVPLTAAPAWYLGKWAFFVFNFTLEIIVVYFWLLVRIDQRLYTPNKAKGPYSYAGGFVFAGEAGNEKKDLRQRRPQEMEPDQSQSTATSRRNLIEENTSRKTSGVTWGGRSVRHSVAETLYQSDRGSEAVNLSFLDDAPAHPVALASEENSSAEHEIDGTEHEMGWDGDSGRWVLRSISSQQEIPPRRALSPRVRSVVMMRDDGQPEVAEPSKAHTAGSAHSLSENWFPEHIASQKDTGEAESRDKTLRE